MTTRRHTHIVRTVRAGALVAALAAGAAVPTSASAALRATDIAL